MSKKRIFVAGAVVIALVGVYGAVQAKYGSSPSLTTTLITNCSENIKKAVRSPSTFKMVSADATSSSFFSDMDKDAYVNRTSFNKQYYEKGRAEFKRYIVKLDYDAQSALGQISRNEAYCTYSALDFDGSVNGYPDLASISIGGRELYSPYIYGEGVATADMLALNFDTKDSQKISNYFRWLFADVDGLDI